MRLQRRGKSTGGGRKRARTGYRGFITVYLALVTGILLSLFVTLLEASRRDLIRMQIECVTDMALQSALAQYHRQMLEQYDLFFIDTSEFLSFVNCIPTTLFKSVNKEEYSKHNLSLYVVVSFFIFSKNSCSIFI